VLAIPYSLSKSGFIAGALDIIVLGIAVLFLNLYLGEIVLRNKKKHQLTGYAQKYLGKNGKRLMAFTMMFTVYGALTAYMMGIGKSASALLGMQNSFITLLNFSFNTDIGFGILFFIFASSLIWLGISGIEESEFVMTSVLVFVMIVISLIAFGGFNLNNVIAFNPSKIFLPYGVVLFALAGAIAIPESGEELKNKRNLKKVIIIGTLVPIFLYLIFSLSVIGLCGTQTSEIAVSCLSSRFGGYMNILGNIFAIFAMATSFLALGLGLKEMYGYDYKMSNLKSWALTCLLPLAIFLILSFLINNDKFFKVINLTGGIAMTLQGILIVLMFNKAKKLGDRKPEYSIKKNKIILSMIIIIFLAGMIYTAMNFLGII
jgi:tyrosine-specific transport protein